MQPLVLILIVLLIAAALVPLGRVRHARRKQLASLSMHNGWTYTASDPWNLPSALEGLWLGAWGHDRRCRDVISVPTAAGSLWLGQFERQMSSGRHRRTQRFALAVARVTGVYGGVAILPGEERFAPAEPFGRYRRVEEAPGVERQVWAERAESERDVIERLAGLQRELPASAGLELRGSTAVVYWPLGHSANEQTFRALEAAGRGVIEILRTQEEG